ncbi:geranylgeranylglycerol-phosphate geranylgeranyltransferase [Chlorogloeopsis sp. ULAP01]|uniref:geranylgeranylglycerol-phosphate geranylgeranyltransferase n=1 Tax=Chlorogloeopsis sp. ULAP01 TaxID=3056483 RepID=UPI0025AA83A4|nr:geranylgeranylglycerol-phosphate geranylgeranyltransferase [Chlorogloeopsis sp. ULAP01]MDM9379224.1 geranylgeranylglycerol-phosphate geranylgeranyltransferase [Chlorogloeopsis sp. ULAP01]
MSEQLQIDKKTGSFTSASGNNNSSLPDSSDKIRLIRDFAQLFRLPVAILAALVGCATIYALNSAVPLYKYLLTAIILVCTHSAACAINDYWDVEKDKIDHPQRPLPSGRLSLQQVWWAATILFVCALIAAIPLGIYCLILVAVSSILLWNYSHLLARNGIFANFIVAAIAGAIIFLGSLVVNRPLALLYPSAFAFCYTLAKEIIWDVHDAAGDRAQGIITVVNSWGKKKAFSISWGLIGMLLVSIPLAVLLLPMAHPLIFGVFSSVMLLMMGMALARYQYQDSVNAYEGFVFWDRIGMLVGAVGLLGAAPAV